MRILVGFCRIFIGIFFIISGFIKLNDPVGFAFKLEEYFGPTVLDLPFFMPYALAISVVVVVFEVLLGLFLIIGYKPKFTVWSLLLMIIFFTFLTFYSAYFDKVKDCGCFGDAMAMTPWESFTKDAVLLVLILIVFVGVKYIKPFFNSFVTTLIALVGFIASLGFAYHVLMHLPSIDFRPYRLGANIQQNMSVPDNAPKAIIEYTYVFNVNGKEEKHTVTEGYPEVDGELLRVETKTIRDAYEPPIHDFSIEKDGVDFTSEILELDNVLLIVAYNLEKAEAEGLKIIKAATDEAIANGYDVIGLTATGPNEQSIIKENYNLNFDFYFCDETALKTIVRSNPGVLKLEKGTVIQKLHFNDIDKLELPVVERAPEPEPIVESPFVTEDVDNTLFMLNGEEVTLAELDAIDAETIENVNVIKDSMQIKAITSKNYTSVIQVTLKD